MCPWLKRIGAWSGLGQYFVQGLPFGFQARALPVYLRAEGVELHTISLASTLSVAWLLKPLWAPMVDTVYVRAWGRRKSWIVPMQLAMVVLCAAIAELDRAVHASWLFAAVFVLNLCAATQDIAVDGLAVDLLADGGAGAVNAVQVGGYKVGMLLGGGALLWLSAYASWFTLFYGMAACIAVVAAVVVVAVPESDPVSVPSVAARSGADRPTRLAAQVGRALWPLTDLVHMLGAMAARPGFGWVLLLVGTYKTGEAIVDTMFKHFLQDHGWTVDQLGLSGIAGAALSLAGSAAGGWLTDGIGIIDALMLLLLVRPWPLMGKVVLAYVGVAAWPSAQHAVMAAEALIGGAVTTAVYALMMSVVDPARGATQYTVLASLDVLGRSLGSVPSGWLVQALGYPGAFAVGTALAWLVVPLVPRIHRAHLTPTPAATPAQPPPTGKPAAKRL
jgi:MFS transporter, PAT family, beta-lactamase induction signal transducer AmpG